MCVSKNHPLDNSVVLKRLFELIPFELKDFQSFRLVSRAWKNVSLSTWRKTAPIILHDKQDDKSVTHDSEDGKISWQKYLELLENNEHKLVQHPFRKYSFYSYKFDLQSVNQDGEQGKLRFWNKVGPMITHLTLNFCEFAGVSDFRTIVFEKTPNLQSLFFYKNMYPNEGPVTKAQRLDPNLLQHALIPPEQVQNNLKEFDVKFIRDGSENEVAGEDENEDTDEDENEVTDEDENEVTDEDVNEVTDKDENEVTDEDENEVAGEDENEVAGEDENEVEDEDGNEDTDEDEDENEVAGEDIDEVVDTFPNSTGSRFPITWMEFLIHFPNIKRFGGITLNGVGAFRLGTEADFQEFFETVEILRRQHGSRYLADLDDLNLVQDWESSSDFGRQLFSTINRLSFPIQRLSFQVNKTVDEETFKQLLQHPLKYLAVERTKYVNYEVRPFQNFPFGLNFFALKELYLWGPIAPNLVFLKKCPNLEKFTYSPISGNRLDDFSLTQGLGDTATKLEKLTCLSIDCGACNAEEIQRLGELMPNVTDLEAGLDDGSFRAVCEVWKNLEYLRIESWKIGEEALLGKDKQSGENFRHPNLTDLKKLKAFFMERFRKESDQQGFTSAMILDGILALRKLEKVSLLISSEVSSRVLNQLKMAIPKCCITIQTEAPSGGDEFAMAAAQFQQNRTDNP